MSPQPFEIHYDAVHGEPIADGRVQERASALADRLKDTAGGQETVASELYLIAVRLLIRQGVIDPHAVVFKFNGEIVPLHTDPTSPNLGKHIEYPQGFGDHFENLLFGFFDPPANKR